MSSVPPVLPDHNPKTAAGSKKAPLHLVPPITLYQQALAFSDGAAKYGPYNWRETGAAASIYYAAALRHLMSWWDGEDLSPDARITHLAHAQACLSILLDVMAIGRLIDDRPGIPGGLPAALEEYARKHSIPVPDLEQIKQTVFEDDFQVEVVTAPPVKAHHAVIQHQDNSFDSLRSYESKKHLREWQGEKI